MIIKYARTVKGFELDYYVLIRYKREKLITILGFKTEEEMLDYIESKKDYIEVLQRLVTF